MKSKSEGENIGKNIIITASSNKLLVGMAGKVVDETKNLLVIRTDKGEKKLLKKQIKFEEK